MRHVGEARRGVGVAQVLDLHVGLDGQGTRGELQGVAERSVRVRNAEEEIAVLVLRRASENAAIARHHVDCGDVVVHEPMAERRGLDAHAGHRAAQRDRLELRHDRGHHAVRERRVGEIDVAHHSLGFDEPGGGVDRKHVIEALEIDRGPRARLAVAEEVRCFLGESDARPGPAAGPEFGEEVRLAVGVRDHGLERAVAFFDGAQNRLRQAQGERLPCSDPG